MTYDCVVPSWLIAYLFESLDQVREISKEAADLERKAAPLYLGRLLSAIWKCLLDGGGLLSGTSSKFRDELRPVWWKPGVEFNQLKLNRC